MERPEKITDRPRMLKELATYYSISVPTMRRWLEVAGIKKVDGGRYYSVKEIKRIIDEFGENV